MLRGQKNTRILAGRNKAILLIAIKFLFSSIIPVLISFYCPIRMASAASVLSFLDCVTKLRQHLPSRTKLVITRELLASLEPRKGGKREHLETRDIVTQSR